MAEKFICPICGEVTSSYMGNYRKDRLCRKHATDLKNGKITFCDKCQTWHETNKPCKCSNKSQEKLAPERTPQPDSKCIVCGKNAPNGPLCKDCYGEMLDFKESVIDKNSKLFEIKDYYFNLKSNIYRMKNFEYIQSNCNKLMALAVLAKELHEDESLTDRIVNDIKEIIEKKRPSDKIVDFVNTEYAKTQDSHKEETLRATDGHYVKSYPEMIIDDILYELRIVHCYTKKVITNSDEPTIEADWFIPVTDGRHGIYIEYWGMNSKEYLENKERKRKAYKKHDIPLIEIEKDDYKDKQGLTDRLQREITKFAFDYFRVVDFLK